jgi:hypothetical protein
MIFELRTYTLVPGKVNDYLRTSAEVGRKARGDNYGTLRGFWFTEFGTLNQVVHLWEYPDLNERERLRAELQKNEDWTRGYLPQIRQYLLAQQNKILAPVLPLKPPAAPGHLYELRWYRMHVGRLAEWLGHFRDIMPTREKYSKNVGVWQTEAGTLNEAVHLWAYRDLNDRAAVRGAVLRDPAWQEFLARSAPCLAEMSSIILNPAPHSPMK